MQVFRSPFKSASSKAPDQGASGSGADVSALDTSQMSPEELRALLQSQQEAIGHLQARLESLAVAERNTVLDLTTEAVEQLLRGDNVASWISNRARRCGTTLEARVLPRSGHQT